MRGLTCSWFQSIGVISIWSVYFTSSLFPVPNGRVGQLPWIPVLVRNQLSTSSCPSAASAMARPSPPFNSVLRSARQQREHCLHPQQPLSSTNQSLLPVTNIRGMINYYFFFPVWHSARSILLDVSVRAQGGKITRTR